MKKTAIIYDPDFLLHDSPGHPENAGRLRSIMERLETNEVLARLDVRSAKEAPLEVIYEVHSPEFVAQIQKFSEYAGEKGEQISGDNYLNCHTYKAALKGVGGLLELCNAVIQGELANGFNFSRPPGHHATPGKFMGFCFFSTAGIIATHLIRQKLSKRLAIVDFDVHHGNGTEAVCEEEPNILFVSTHQDGIYPRSGREIRVGSGKGQGTTINCPLPANTETSEYLRLMDRFILPKLEQFNPDFVLVSAGYDAHWRDPLAGLSFSAEGYGRISQKLVEFADRCCDGKIVFNLEGGYDLPALANSAENSVLALLHDFHFSDDFGETDIHDEIPNLDPLIEQLQNIHSLK